jgi:TRAP-type C4-dicarboxylate transport system permease small subunit
MDQLKIKSRFSMAIMLVAGGLIVLATAIITVEVILRKLFSLSIGGADELSGYCFAIACVLAWVYCAIERANISIDALHARLPLKARALLDFLGLALLFAVAGVLVATAYSVVADSARNGARSLTPLATPLVIPQSIWFVGLIILFLVLGLMLLRCFAALARGEWRRVAEIAGVATTEEMITEEIASARQRENSARGTR